MRAVPKRWWHADDAPLKALSWLPNASGLVIECEVTQPESSVGRTVYVSIEGEDVEHFMKELRRVAIERRSHPISSEHGSYV